MDYEKKQRIYKTIMIILLTATITFLLSTVIMYQTSKDTEDIRYLLTGGDQTAYTTKSATLKQLIDLYYRGEVNDSKMTEGALKGYIAGLGDEYTEYLTKEEWKDLEETTNGNYVGIGIYMMQTTNNEIVIVKPIKGSPAEAAGIKTGDIIIKVDDVEYEGETMSEASNKIKGEAGTKVKLEIKREENILTLEIERKEIDINQVDEKVLSNNIGYLELTTFDKGCSTELEEKYMDLKSKGIKGLIIDLRNNTGGIVEEALNIADLMTQKDSTLLITVDKKEQKQVYKAKRDKVIDVPVVVLVNDYSASASEILAGALQDNKAATIVGIKTYGKGVIQSIYELKDGTAMKITTNEYYTPNEKKINKEGITPDIIVELPKKYEDELKVEQSKDTQLQKAMELLQKDMKK